MPRTPALVWFHGGGWVTGSLDAVDPLCRALTGRTGAPLTSVAYRLAPEHAFPAAHEDCVAVLRSVAQDGPVAVGGDSVGGGLAAAACLALRAEGLPVVGQVLVNPLLDATLSCPSVDLFAEGYGLTRDALESFVALYLRGDEGEAYAVRLADAGVPVALRRFDEMVHGFTALPAHTPVADEALDWAVDALVRLVDG